MNIPCKSDLIFIKHIDDYNSQKLLKTFIDVAELKKIKIQNLEILFIFHILATN